MSNPAIPSVSRRCWVVFVVAWLVVFSFVFALQQRQLAARARYVAADQAAAATHQRAISKWRSEQGNPFRDEFKSTHVPGTRPSRRPATREELKARLFPSREPGPSPSHVRMPIGGVAWDDPERGLVFLAEFDENGVLQSFGIERRTAPLPRPLPSNLHPLLQSLEPYRRAWAGRFTSLTIGPVLWNLLFIAALIPSRYALRLAHAQLATALLCLLGWLVAIDYPITPQGIVENDMLPWGLGMVAISGIVLAAVSARSRRADPRFCAACGYDLTGNVSGVCPECGLDRNAEPTS